jgi:carbonic anhydrase/acetyltransferase-like protein (isoleucine patch superfamily)
MILGFKQQYPEIHPTAYIADSAAVIGDVVIGEDASVWFNTVVRGDIHYIRVGNCSNIQDNTVVHVTHDTAPVCIGDRVTIGHGALIHGCTIESDVLIGIGAILLDNCRIGTGSMVAAGTIVTEGTVVPPGSLVMGQPGRVRRPMRPEDLARVEEGWSNYLKYKAAYIAEREAPA